MRVHAAGNSVAKFRILYKRDNKDICTISDVLKQKKAECEHFFVEEGKKIGCFP